MTTFEPIKRPQLLNTSTGWTIWYHTSSNNLDYSVAISFRRDDYVVKVCMENEDEVRVYDDEDEYKRNEDSLYEHEEDREVISAWHQRHMPVEQIQTCWGVPIEIFITDAKKRWSALQYLVQPSWM